MYCSYRWTLNFLKGIKEILLSKMEFSVWSLLFKRCNWKYWYHLSWTSWLSYFNPSKSFLNRNGFDLIDVNKGSHAWRFHNIRNNDEGENKVSDSVNQLIKEEHDLGLDKLCTYQKFSKQIETTGNNLKVKELKNKGKNYRLRCSRKSNNFNAQLWNRIRLLTISLMIVNGSKVITIGKKIPTLSRVLTVSHYINSCWIFHNLLLLIIKA